MSTNIKMGNKSGMSRRTFLVGTGAAVLGATALSAIGCSAGQTSGAQETTAPTEEYKPDSKVVCDVVVVGSGCSGVCAAASAAESGMRVVLIDKMGAIGGVGSGTYMVYYPDENTDLVAAANTWVVDNHYAVDRNVVDALLNNVAPTIDWAKGLGWEFTPGAAAGLADTLILPYYGDRGRIDLFQAMLDKTGVEVQVDMTAKQIIQDADGTVTGIYAADSDGNITEFDCKAIAMATGGYAGDTDKVKEACSRKVVCGGCPQNIGEGLDMLWTAGGNKASNYGIQMFHQTLTDVTANLRDRYDDFPSKYPLVALYMPQFVALTAKGTRFRNEEYCTEPSPGAISSVRQGEYYYLLVSASQLEKLENGGMASLGITSKPGISPDKAPSTYTLDESWTNARQVFKDMVDDENAFSGDTIEELAEAAGLDPETLSKTVSEYESFCASGVDTQCGKSTQNLLSYGDGPYYLIKGYQNNLTSWGGIDVDEQFRVLDTDANAIPGLYAIGVEAGSPLYSDQYIGLGVGMAFVFVSGHLSGQNMASYVAQG